MKALNGWTDHPLYKILSPLIPAVIIAAIMFWGTTGQTISKIEAKLSDMCGDIDEFKKLTKELNTIVMELNTSRGITNYRLEAIEKKIDRVDARNSRVDNGKK